MKKEHEVLFDPIKIGSVEVKNRYVMSPMGPFGLVDQQGIPTDEGVEYYVTRAKGGIGLVMTGICVVEDEFEQTNPTVLFCTKKTDKWRLMQQWSKMAERIHAYGSKIFVQLTAGFGRAAMIPAIARNAVGPSEIPNRWDKSVMHRELTTEEVEAYIKGFIQAAAFAKHCGMDGVEIHAVHEGYLLDQFATEVFNHRTDRFGGSFENRYRFATEIVQGIKKVCGESFPVSLRYSPKHYMKDQQKGIIAEEDCPEMGRDMPEGIRAAKLLVDAGYDALNVDLGCYDSHYWNHPSVYQEDALYLDAASKVKEVVDVPIIVAGRMDNPDVGAEAIRSGKCDMISLGRPSLADPNLPNKIQAGHPEQVRPCISCNYGCSAGVMTRARISCAVNAQCAQELRMTLTPALVKKKVVVIGGGPGGAECARVMALRGHDVTLFEKADRIGGSLIVASKASFKKHDLQLADWFADELRLQHVDVRLNTAATVEAVKECEPDIVVCATGADPFIAPIPGADKACIAEDILNDISKAGKKIVIIGAGQVGVETGLWLIKEGHEIDIVEVTDKFMPQGHISDVAHAQDILDYYGGRVHLSTVVEEVCDDGVVIKENGQKSKLEADTVIIATGYHANSMVYKEMRKAFDCVYNIGDSTRARNIYAAVHEGYELGSTI